MLNIILYEPEIPGNTGNIIRICYATGAKLHIIKPIAFDLDPLMMKRSGAGRMISDIDHEVHESYTDFVTKYGQEKIYYITRYGEALYSDINFKHDENVFVMFGRESTGIPKTILQSSLSTCLRIPMLPHERSINLANAVAVVVYEIARQNDFHSMSKYEVQKGRDFLRKK